MIVDSYAIRRQLEHVPTKAGLLNPQLSPFFEELLASLLEKDPADRIATSLDLVAIEVTPKTDVAPKGLEATLRSGFSSGTLSLGQDDWQVQLVLDLTSLNQVLRPYGSLEEALAGL